MRSIRYLLSIFIIGLAISCTKSETPKSSEAKLFKVTGSFGVGIIDTTAKTVTIKAPDNMDITQIIPKFEMSKNATIYPPSGVAIDFTNPVTYTISSEDNATKFVFKVTVIKPIVKFTVYDVSNWTSTNNRVLQTDAIIKIYTKSDYVGTDKLYDSLISDQNGQALLYGLKTNDYYLTVSKDNKSNIVNGYILIGRYNTQVDADSSPDPNAKVGGLKFLDLNGDNIVNSYDKTNSQIIRSQYDLETNSIFIKDLYISN